MKRRLLKAPFASLRVLIFKKERWSCSSLKIELQLEAVGLVKNDQLNEKPFIGLIWRFFEDPRESLTIEEWKGLKLILGRFGVLLDDGRMTKSKWTKNQKKIKSKWLAPCASNNGPEGPGASAGITRMVLGEHFIEMWEWDTHGIKI